MKRALLADDDFLVRSYLKMLPSWEKAGFEIAGDVRDGEEALDVLKSKKIDVVITDIAMPLMDGIELIRAIRKDYSDIYIIVLSCHDEFEYVKEAMKEGADEYVLKNTLNEESLCALLKTASEKLDEKSASMETDIDENESESGTLKKEGGRNSANHPEEEFSKINRKFLYFNQILAGTLSAEEQEEQRLQAGIRGKYTNSAVIVMKVDAGDKSEDPWLEIKQEQYCLDFLGRFQRALRKMPAVFETEKEVIYLGNGVFCCFIDLSDIYKGSVMYQKLTNVASGCYKVCKEEKHHFQIGVSNICIGSEAIRQAYQQAREMIKAGFYEQDFIVYYEPGCEPGRELPREAVSLLEKTDELVRKNEKAEFQKMAEAAVKAFWQNRTESTLVITWLKKLEQKAQSPARLKHWNLHNISQVPPLLEEISGRLFEFAGADIPENLSDAVSSAAAFARRHFREPIGLNDAAEAAGVNSTYLSYRFGQEMGVGFANYLLGLRLNYAKKLLRESSLKIGQIGQQAGFNDYHYFSKVFKKAEGVSPAQYRRGR